MITAGWRGKTIRPVNPALIQMRRNATMQASNYGMGGSRRTRQQRKPITLPKLTRLEEPADQTTDDRLRR